MDDKLLRINQQFKRATNPILGVENVRQIKRLLAQPYDKRPSTREIAQAYGVAPETIRKIDRGDTWGWLSAEDRPLGADGLVEVSDEAVRKSQEKLLAQLKAEALLGPKVEAAVEDLTKTEKP